jgi:hypothetical protein
MEGAGGGRTENQMSRAAVHVSRPVYTIEVKDHVRSSVWSLESGHSGSSASCRYILELIL